MTTVLVAMTLFATTTAVAQDDLEEEARALFQAGRVAFDAGRYDDALEHFDDAYARSQRPQLLYNVGLAADRAGRVPLAIRAYTKFLEEVADSPHRGTVEERLAALRAQQAASQPSQTPTQPDAPPLIMGPAPTSTTPTEPMTATQPEPEARPEAQQPDPQQPTVTGPVAQPTQPDRPTERRMAEPPNRTGPVVFILGGAALLVGGAALVGLAFQAKSEAEGEIMYPRANDANGQARRRSGAGFALLGLGVAVAVTGFVWRTSQNRDVALTLGPDRIGIRGTF